MRRSQRAGESSLPPLPTHALLAAAVDAAARAALTSPFLITLRDHVSLFQCTGLNSLNALDSIHVGLLLKIMVLRHLQKSGHRPILLVGGGTRKVDSPTGEDDGRILLDNVALQRNTGSIPKVFQTFLSFDDAEEEAPGPQQRLALVPPVPRLPPRLWLHFTINFMLPSSSALPVRPPSASLSSTT